MKAGRSKWLAGTGCAAGQAEQQHTRHCPHAAGLGPSDGEGGGSVWLKRAFSMLEQEDVEVDLEQLATLAKVGTGVQGGEERDSVTKLVVLLPLTWLWCICAIWLHFSPLLSLDIEVGNPRSPLAGQFVSQCQRPTCCLVCLIRDSASLQSCSSRAEQRGFTCLAGLRQ